MINNNHNNEILTPAHFKNLKLTPQDDGQDDQNSCKNVVRRTQIPTITTTTTTARTILEETETTTNNFLNLLYNNDSLARSRLASDSCTKSAETRRLLKHKNVAAVNSFNFNCTNNLNVNFKHQQQQHNTSMETLSTSLMTRRYDKSITRWSWSLLKLLSLSSSSSSSSLSSTSSSASAATTACITFLILSTTCSLCSASLCESQSWWDPYKDRCIPCTVCQGDMIPLRPCQMHRDTVCGSIYDLKIDWVVLSKTEPNWKERRKFDGLDYGLDHHQLTAEQLQQLQDETDPMDWQTAALFLAVLACLLFFIVAACILVHHMRQWRRMERRLDQDVEELSTKLMAKLAEVQSLEGGTFFIGNADALRIPTTAAALTTATATFHQPQHVLLPEKSDKNQQNLQHDHRLFHTNMTTLKSGNVYIEENSSKC